MIKFIVMFKCLLEQNKKKSIKQYNVLYVIRNLFFRGICQTKHPVRYAIGGSPIDPVSDRMLINRLALPMEEPAIAAEAPAVMVKTRQTATEGAVSITTPPPPC